MENLKGSKRAIIFFTLMLTGEIVFLLPFVVARIFRPTFLTVFDITNFELGSAFSVYGIVAMVSYFFGGPIADRYSPRVLMSTALVITAVGGWFMASIPNLTGLTILYAFWGVSTILLYWAASIKAIRAYGQAEFQGRAYGLVDGGRGFVAAFISSISVFLFDFFLPVPVEEATHQDMSQALSGIIYLFVGIIFLSGALVWFVFPKKEESTVSNNVSFDGIKNAAKSKTVWLQAIIVLCSYVAYKTTDDFSLYANEVLLYNDVESAHVGTVSFWVRPIAALGAGLLGDRFIHSRMIKWCFGIIIAGGLVFSSGIIHPGIGGMALIIIASTSVGIYGLRGLYFALFQEGNVALGVTGATAGFVSLVGYTPDVFMGPLMGYLLDNNPGEYGHQLVFVVLIVFATIGLMAAHVFGKIAKVRV